jgi:hypothetical protein
MIEKKLKRLTSVPGTPNQFDAYRFHYSVDLNPADFDEYDTYRGISDHLNSAYLKYFEKIGFNGTPKSSGGGSISVNITRDNRQLTTGLRAIAVVDAKKRWAALRRTDALAFHVAFFRDKETIAMSTIFTCVIAYQEKTFRCAELSDEIVARIEELEGAVIDELSWTTFKKAMLK